MRDKQQRMYSTMPNLVLAFHGCDISVFDSIVRQGESMHISTNEYDWLGNGMYFWEQDLERAWKWAEDAARKANGNVKTPAVIGAVIDRGYCLNFLDNRTPRILKQQYEMFRLKMELRNKQMPVNRDIRNDTDKLLRYLDCAVIEDLHDGRAQKICVRLTQSGDCFRRANHFMKRRDFMKKRIFRFASEIQTA